MEFEELREVVENIELVDGHAHNIVSLDSSFPFIQSFSEATGPALSYAPYSLSFKVLTPLFLFNCWGFFFFFFFYCSDFFLWQRNLKNIAELYGCDSSLQAVEEYRRAAGLQSICSICFEAANISAVLIDDGLKLDKKHGLDWHKGFVPFVGRILRIERLAEEILDQVSYIFQLFFFSHF